MGMTPFTDPTPLAELTDEQWKQLGFNRRDDCWKQRSTHYIVWRWDNGIIQLSSLSGHSPVRLRLVEPTVCRLRALLYALGGET